MVKKFVISLLLIGSCAVMQGCETSDAKSVSTSAFVRKAAPEVSRASVLVAGDSIELSVEVDGRMEVVGHGATINHAGMVTLPLVGDVKIDGLTLSNARNVIAKTYGSYYVNPPVVMISRLDDSVEGEWGFVTVTGRVGNPGQIKISSAKGIKLTTAIQEAGGFATSAKKSGIKISRTEKSGRKIQTEVDYERMGQDGNTSADVDLMDGDWVYVPERIF